MKTIGTVSLLVIIVVTLTTTYAQQSSKQKTLQQAQKELLSLKTEVSSIKKGEFEKTEEFVTRKTNLERKINRQIYDLLKPSYPATVKVTLGNYQADSELLPLTAEGVNEDLFLKVDPSEAKYIKNNSSKITAMGRFWLEDDEKVYLSGRLKLMVGSKTYESLPGSDIHFVRLPVYFHGYVAEFSPDGKKFLTVNDGEIALWDLATMTITRKLSGQGKPSFSWDGKLIAVPRADNLDLVDIASGETIRTIPYHVPYGQAHYGNVYTAYFSPTGRLIAIQHSELGGVRLVDAQSGKEILKTRGVGSCSFSSDGSLLILGPVVYDVKSMQSLWAVEVNVGLSGNECVAFCGETNVIAGLNYAFVEHQIIFWDVATRKEIERITLGEYVDKFEVSSDGKILVAAHVLRSGRWIYNVSAIICSIERFRKLRVITTEPSDPKKPVNVALSPNGSILAVGKWLYEIIRKEEKLK